MIRRAIAGRALALERRQSTGHDRSTPPCRTEQDRTRLSYQVCGLADSKPRREQGTIQLPSAGWGQNSLVHARVFRPSIYFRERTLAFVLDAFRDCRLGSGRLPGAGFQLGRSVFE